jgi:hypothetical protein
MKTTLIGDNENKTETLDSVPNFQRGDKTKYVLDATKERLEKAPKVEGKNYERLYARETAEPIFIYGKKRGSSNRKPRSLDGGQDSGICSNVWEDGKTLAALKRVFFRVALSSVVGDDRRVRALANSKFRVPR